jgi:hypothetical protein
MQQMILNAPDEYLRANLPPEQAERIIQAKRQLGQ